MANLCELFDNIVQMQALNGVPLANGKLYVYALGRTRLMDTWSDVDGESLNTNPIILDDAGQAHVYVSDDFDYTLVVCDAYNNEVFSIDKYLYSKGEHSHADVAVAPSEHIAVSSYHVGETTVYVPYIQGELGKTYHGIEPIVVNNQENKISARNIPLGVQEPLYFVEDSESACIIGADTSAFGGNSTLTLRTNGIKDGTYDTLGTYTPLSGSKNIDIPREVYTFTIGNQSCFYNDVIMAYLNSKVLVALEIESWYEGGQQKQNVYENFAQKQFWGNNNFYNGGYVNFVRVDVEKNQIVTWKCEPETPGSTTGYAKWTKTVTDLGSGGLFIAEYGNPGTTYEEIDEAFNAGKTVIAHKKDGNIDQYYQLCEIRKYPDHTPNVDCYVFAYRYSYIVEELFRFQSNWSNMATHLATWDYVDQQISAGDFATHADLSSYATQDWVNNQSYMHEYMESAFYPMESNPSGYLTEHQSLAGYMQESKLETADGKITGYDGTAFAGGSVDPSEFIPWSASGDFQEKGDYYSASNPSGFINSDAISAMATTGFVAGISGEITAMIPTALTGDYLTKDSADTLYYPLTSNPSGYLTTAEFAYYDTAISSIDNSALYDTSAHARINTLAGRISDLSSNKLDSSAFSIVSGEFATVSSKADTSAIIDYTNKPSANAISADDHTLYIKNEYGIGGEVLGNQSGFYVHAAYEGYGFIAGATPYNYKNQGPSTVLSYHGISSLSTPNNIANGPVVEAGWSVNGLTTKQTMLNTSAGVTILSGVYQINDNKTHYLSAKQDVSGMTAYQPAGNYLTTGDSANFYTTANESGFITGVPDTYLQNTDLSTEDGKVTAISGIPLSAGGDVPEGVMVESGLEYNAVNEISGYNGSAIAQYGAEKQWLVHDDTLVHAANSAQYALGVNLSAVAQLLGVDETVLWSGETFVTTSRNIINLSESMYNFNSIKIYDRSFSNNQTDAYATTITEVSMLPSAQEIGTSDTWVDFYQMTASGSHYFGRNYYSGNTDGTKLVTLGSYIKSVNSTAAYSYRGVGKIFKIVGVHRISG